MTSISGSGNFDPAVSLGIENDEPGMKSARLILRRALELANQGDVGKGGFDAPDLERCVGVDADELGLSLCQRDKPSIARLTPGGVLL